MTIVRRRAPHDRGQALVEFSLVLIPFLFLLMGVLDLGRGIYINNGIAQAAREIARITATHPCTGDPCTLGNSPETGAVTATQKGLVPGLADASSTITLSCTDITDAVRSSTNCGPPYFVRVHITVPFSVLTPLLSMVAPATLSTTTHVEIHNIEIP
jgi:Flp pilus assembly protein TadG